MINAVYSQNLLMYVANNNTPVAQKIMPDLVPKDIDEPKPKPTNTTAPKTNAVGGLFSRIRQRLGI